ncbi:MAG: hypothetical protein WCF18_09120 [Chthoniobacteraceae bacterium]
MSAPEGKSTGPSEGGPWRLGIFVLWIAFVAASIVACGAGFLRPEAFTFLPHYLQHRPWYEIVFDTAGTDLDTYQARELGHLLTYLDSRFILESVVAGYPHFFSVTHYVLLLACGLLIWQIGVRSLALPRGTVLGLILLLWSSPSAFLFSSYYRAGKIGLCFGTLLFAAVWFSFQHTPAVAQRRERQLLAWLGVAALLLPMFDKQGLVFLFVATAFCVQRALVTQCWKDRAALVSVGTALFVALVYNWAIGPSLTLRLGNAAPDLTYQSLPIASFLRHPRHLAVVFFGAPLMALNSLQFVAGNLSTGLLVAALGGVWWVLARLPGQGAEPWRSWFRPERLYLALLALVVAMFAILLIRNPLMFSNEHRRFFYGAPMAAVWIVALAVIAAHLQQLWPERRGWITFGVFVLVVGNVFALPEHRFVLRQGKYATFRQNARRLVYSLAPERILNNRVNPADATALLAATPSDLADSPRSIAEDRIYLVLLAEYWARTQAKAGPTP